MCGSREGSPEEELIIVDHLPVFATECAKKKIRIDLQPGFHAKAYYSCEYATRARARLMPFTVREVRPIARPRASFLTPLPPPRPRVNSCNAVKLQRVVLERQHVLAEEQERSVLSG